MLKSHYLGGKHNRRVDYIIKTLVKKFVPDFEIRHEWQTVRLEGWDLESKRRQQILASAKTFPLDSIHQVNDTEFFVASQSYPDHHYMIDLSDSTYDCDCDDFPRIQFCKHIAAVNVHFPKYCPELFPEPEGSSSSDIPEHMRTQDLPKSAPESDADEERVTLLKDINTLYQQLTALSDDATPDLEALKLVKHSLNAAIALANGSRALPEKDDFNPNQKTWAGTVERMGAQKAPKRKPGPVGENTTERCIGAVKGKRRKYSNPYAAGERSGKCAKPDAVSATANEHARAHLTVPAPPPPCAAVLAPARATPSAAAAGSAEGSFTCANRSTAVLLAHPPSSVVPGLAFSPFPAALQGNVFAPSSSGVPEFAYARRSAQAFFRAQIMPRNAVVHSHFSPGPST